VNGLNRAKDFCGQPQHWDCDFSCVVLPRRPTATLSAKLI